MIDHNEIGQGQAPDGIVHADLYTGDNGDNFLSKPVAGRVSEPEGDKN